MALFSRTKSPEKNPENSDLSVTVKEPGPCRRTVTVRLTMESVHPVRQEILAQFQKDAQLPGFRKGKAPAELIEQKYGDSIREETKKRLAREVLDRVATERKFRPVGPFEVSRLELDDIKGLELDAQVEIEPEFELATYRAIPLTKVSSTVTPQDLEQALNQLRESMAKLVPTGEGDKKEKQLPNLDDELAKDIGLSTLAELREHVQAKLVEQKRRQQSQMLEQALCEELVTRHQFTVPQGLVQRQAQRLAQEFQMRLLMSGYTEEQVKEQSATYTEQMKTNAAGHVKLAFILEHIAEREHLQVTQDELVERLWTLSQRWKKDPVEVRRLLDERGLWPSVVSSIRQEKTVKFLLDAARVTEPDAPAGNKEHA